MKNGRNWRRRSRWHISETIEPKQLLILEGNRHDLRIEGCLSRVLISHLSSVVVETGNTKNFILWSVEVITRVRKFL
jgi:hypothetical protein